MYRALGKHLVLPMVDRYAGMRIAEYRKILEATQWLKREEVLHLQQERLTGLLNHAYENVPYYHKVFKDRGLRPSDVRTVEDLKKLPILKKRDIARMPQQLMSKSLSEREMMPYNTAGTTAESLRFYRTKDDVSWNVAAEFRTYGWGGYELGDKLALIWIFEPNQLKNPLFKLRNLATRQTVSNTRELSEESIRSLSERMRRVKPAFLRGLASKLYMLAMYVLAEGTPQKLKAVFSTSEILLPSQRKVIERAFGCEVFDYYGSHEVLSMASECEEHSGYHIASENVLLEFVKDGEQVAPGERGTILVTSLHNYAMPFIRYDIGDTGKPSDETCRCGRGLSLFKSLEGRTYESFVTGDGTIQTLRDLDIFFENLPVRMFQIVQTSRDDILIKIVKADEYSQRDTDFIERYIAWPRPHKANIKVELVDSIPSERSGKTRYLISKLPTYDWLDKSLSKPTDESG
jgi:phenylacetate-CoA ligase